MKHSEKYLNEKDNICQATENYVFCPDDCPSGGSDELCDRIRDKRCDPDCSNSDVDCGPERKGYFMAFIIIFRLVLGILIVGIIEWLRRKR